ncbi:LRR receptor-like serine/threonine-protein kinase EFR [Camellia lanceoleosa]|uniref:LRR receptor-like serine/threonine-protein kinase EFR n=1 Tax=Camellia lanceoleosa TaxID=1840588 RepID=A0ACC0HXA2_9ERIC|nr:LRR receptor-like serine/threonine-protein kinase EFR [Camellia lanceoleosa]
MNSLLAVLVLILAVQSCIVSLAFPFSNLTDQSALLAFKTAVMYDPNNVLDNWTTRTNFCNWAGVSCSRCRQRVTALWLQSMGLAGTISPHTGNVSFLRRLDLRNNSFHGFVTQNLTRLRRLTHLILQDNLLEGVIPTSIQQREMLQVMSLTGNRLVGRIPDELTTLPLLRGSLDPNIKALKVLESMDLSSNNISGKIPDAIAAFQSFNSLNLSRNSFWGSIPESFGHLITLDSLDLSHKNQSGAIPKALEKLSYLKYLNLSFNRLSGEIPSQGPFKNLIAESFMENEALCGAPTLHVPPCTKYGSEGRVSTKGDIYSCGIMLLETFTRKKPTDEMFIEALTLKQWVNASLPDRVMEVVDGGLLRTEDGRDVIAYKDSLSAIMEVGCCVELPECRTDIKDVVFKLSKIKLHLL